MTDADMKRLSEIEEREKKATAGPWEGESGGWYPMEDCPEWRVWATGGGMDLAISEPADFEQADADLCFIAHSRSDIPWLISLVQTLQKQVEDLDTKLLLARDREANLVIENGELRGALEKIGNKIGGPTMGYCEPVEMSEWHNRAQEISEIARQALGKGG